VAGVCLSTGSCSYGNCTRAIGWWYTHTGWLDTSGNLPVPLGASLVTTSERAAVILTWSQLANKIDSLAASLLTAKLNVLAGALPEPIAATITAADAFLAVCPYDSLATWTAMIRTGMCGGLSIYGIMAITATLDAYDNGVGGVPLCPDSGDPRPH
jgi:hypothetical protein